MEMKPPHESEAVYTVGHLIQPYEAGRYASHRDIAVLEPFSCGHPSRIYQWCENNQGKPYTPEESPI